MKTTALNFQIEAGYVIPDQNTLSQIGVSEKITHHFAFAHGVCSRGGRLEHYGALCFPKRFAITLEQKEFAQKEYARMKAEKLATIGNKLVFVGMGSSYPQRYDDDVCNHRIRTFIINPEGRRFFIELGTWGSLNTRFDHVVDCDLEKEYDEKAAYYNREILNLGGFSHVEQTHPFRVQLEKYRGQPYYWYKKSEWDSLVMQYTKQNVIKIVNKLFGCRFTEMEVADYLISQEDYSSVSPN